MRRDRNKEVTIEDLRKEGLPTKIPLAYEGTHCTVCGSEMKVTKILLTDLGFHSTGTKSAHLDVTAQCPNKCKKYSYELRTDDTPNNLEWIGYGMQGCLMPIVVSIGILVLIVSILIIL